MKRNEVSETRSDLRTIEIRFNALGKIQCCAFAGWYELPSGDLRQCRIFRRDNIAIKIAVYDGTIEFLETFGAWLANALISGDEVAWERVDLRDCDR